MRALKTVAILAVLLMLVGTGIAPVEAQGVRRLSTGVQRHIEGHGVRRARPIGQLFG